MGTPEGVAVFFKQDKFHLEETKTFHLNDLVECTFKQSEIPKDKQVVLLAALRHKISNNLPVVGKNGFKVHGHDENMYESSQDI